MPQVGREQAVCAQGVAYASAQLPGQARVQAVDFFRGAQVALLLQGAQPPRMFTLALCVLDQLSFGPKARPACPRGRKRPCWQAAEHHRLLHHLCSRSWSLLPVGAGAGSQHGVRRLAWQWAVAWHARWIVPG